MSKRDIETVCTLSAHLAHIRTDRFGDGPTDMGACAIDAMRLQRLGRRTRNMFKKAAQDQYGTKLEALIQEKGIIEATGEEVLKPYGLRCLVFGAERTPGFYILELPSNGEHGDGFKL